MSNRSQRRQVHQDRDIFPGGLKRRHPKRYRILLNPFGTIRLIGWSFGWPTLEGTRLDLLDYFKKRLGRLTLVPPRYVDQGPLLENVLVPDDVDLSRFPVPKWHPEDGGSYIGTGCLVISWTSRESAVSAFHRIRPESDPALGLSPVRGPGEQGGPLYLGNIGAYPVK